MPVAQFVTAAKEESIRVAKSLLFFFTQAVESRNEPFAENSDGSDLKLTVA